MTGDLFWLVVVFTIAAAAVIGVTAHLEHTDPEADDYWGNWNPPPLHDGHYHNHTP